MKRWFWPYIIILLFLSVLPINGSNAAINHIFVLKIRMDYLLHCITFIPWAFVAFYKLNDKSWSAWQIIIIGLIFSAFCEGLQYFIPYRSFNINDMASNFLGVLVGSILLILRFSNSFLKIIKQK
jgi:VanZ family protein